MPITSPISFPRLTAAEMREIDYEVMKHAFGMQRNGVMLGNQRFHLMDPHSCVFVTTLASERSAHHEAHLRLFLNHSPLSRAHWINIDLHEIHFVSLETKP